MQLPRQAGGLVQRRAAAGALAPPPMRPKTHHRMHAPRCRNRATLRACVAASFCAAPWPAAAVECAHVAARRRLLWRRGISRSTVLTAAARGQAPGSSRRLVVLHGDEAAWYWGPIATVAAATQSGPIDTKPTGDTPPSDEAAVERARRASEASRRVREAEGLVEVAEVAEEAWDVLNLGDVRRLLLRLCGMFEGDPQGAAGPVVLPALQHLQTAAAMRLEELMQQLETAADNDGSRGNGSSSSSSLGAATAAAGDVASIVWCLAEFDGQLAQAAAADACTGVEGPPAAGADGFVQPRLLQAVSQWTKACAGEVTADRAAAAAAASDKGGNDGKLLQRLAPQLDPLAGPDGVSLTWGLGRLLGSARASMTAQSSSRGRGGAGDDGLAVGAGEAWDALCRAVADGIGAVTAVSPMAPEDLTDLADGVAAAGRRSPATARLLDAVAHEVYRQLSNRHSGTAGFTPPDLVKLTQAYATADYADGCSPRMLDAVASYVVGRVRSNHINSVSRPADLAALLSAYADLAHISVAVPELIRAVTTQVCKGVASAHELLHSRPDDFDHLPTHTRWDATSAARLLSAQLKLGFQPPAAQLRAIGTAVAPRVGEAGWGSCVALVEAFADCSHHPGEQVMAALLGRAEAQLPSRPPPSDLASLLFSCARLGTLPPPALLTAAADGVAAAAEGYSGEEGSSSSSGGGGSGRAAAADAASAAPLKAAQIVRCLWALAALGALTAPRIGWLLVALARSRWDSLSEEQLAAVAAARCIAGSDGAELAEEILPAALLRRVDSAWRPALSGLAGGAGGLLGISGGATSREWAAAEAAADAWLSSLAGEASVVGSRKDEAAVSIQRVTLPAVASSSGGGGEQQRCPHFAAGAWVASPPLELPPSWQDPEASWDDVDSRSCAAACKRQRQLLLLLAPRAAVMGRFPVRVAGELMVQVRVLAALLAGAEGGSDYDCSSAGSPTDDISSSLQVVLLLVEDWAQTAAALTVDSISSDSDAEGSTAATAGGDSGWPAQVLAVQL